MTLSAAQIRQWRTDGLVIMNLSRWSDGGLHEARNGHLLNTKQKCYHFSQRSVNIKQSASLSAGRILSNNRHKRVNFSKNSQMLYLQPKTTTVLAIYFYVGKIAHIILNTYCSHRPCGFAGSVFSIKPCEGATETAVSFHTESQQTTLFKRKYL